MADDLRNAGEQRRHVRRNMLCYLEVVDSDTDTLIGHLVDLTPSGMMLSSTHPVPAEPAFRNVAIGLPRTFGGGHVVVRARRVWSRPDINPSLHAAGFEFVAGAASSEALERLIEEWSFGHP